MHQSHVVIRPFTWAALHTLLTVKGRSSPEDEEQLRRWLRQPGMRPERDCFIADVNGQAAGYGYLIVEEPIQRGVLVLEGARGPVELALVEAAERHAQGMGLAVLHVDVAESDVEHQLMLASCSFEHVRTHWHMRRSDPTLLPVAVPEGMRLRLARREDALAVTTLQNGAFTGSWGYSPNTDEEIEYRVFDLPNPGPDPVLLLEEEGGILAYCWDHRERGGPGIVGMVGVHPSQQGHGLGRVVTAAGINHWVEQAVLPVEITVDSENTPAVRLYQSLGFELQWRSFWYELRLE